MKFSVYTFLQFSDFHLSFSPHTGWCYSCIAHVHIWRCAACAHGACSAGARYTVWAAACACGPRSAAGSGRSAGWAVLFGLLVWYISGHAVHSHRWCMHHPEWCAGIFSGVSPAWSFVGQLFQNAIAVRRILAQFWCTTDIGCTLCVCWSQTALLYTEWIVFFGLSWEGIRHGHSSSADYSHVRQGVIYSTQLAVECHSGWDQVALWGVLAAWNTYFHI